jgi:hypothetical protein
MTKEVNKEHYEIEMNTVEVSNMNPTEYEQRKVKRNYSCKQSRP